MTSSRSDSSPAPAALAAFLRGCERRGAVFAELQCGDADRGDVALAAALRAFRGKAAALPMADWPVRFWTLLAATPQLRVDGPSARWADGFAALARPAAADRAALLLRLAGGLQEVEAAAALGLDDAAYRDALARACPRDSLGYPDAGAWRALAEAIQQHLRELPDHRLATLARLREEALAGIRITPPAPQAGPATAVPAARRRYWILLLAFLLLAAAGAGLWWWRGSPPGATTSLPAVSALSDEGVAALPADPVITSEPLPAPDAPVGRAAGIATADAHADFALLSDPEGEALAREADFLAWYVAGAGAPTSDAGAATDAAR
ncbi:hypothetical protein LJR168_000372 [Pseudoxanthomonas sp. LjRoot168]|uniref:hypothetical protein n=1 Tax=unclassified Pseudoxanthomonas TaxID=2645906 RepID=UPI003ECD9F38